MIWQSINKSREHLHVGDLVAVRSAAEILDTLDENGTRDGLPFMPEMVKLCGQRFSVLRRVEKICVEGFPSTFRKFEKDDVVLLEKLRCSGTDHDGCNRACTLLWKEAWLCKAAEGSLPPELLRGSEDRTRLHNRLITRTAVGTYFCQSTQLCAATEPLSRSGQVWVSFREIWVGNRRIFEVLWLIVCFFWRRLRRQFLGWRPQGNLKKTPAESLNLQPGELVEVKSFPEIRVTLDRNGFNRGMDFSFAMKKFCGKRFRVMTRLDRRINEESGQMQNLRNTVALQGVECQCYYRFAGCPRADLLYFREIWLKRV